jgi:hypothetical protein
MKLKYVKCEMDPFQFSSYKEVINNEENEDTEKLKKNLLKTLNVGSLPNHFFIGTRFISNVVFPNKKVGAEGLESFTKMKILGNLEKYSTKFHKIMSKINGSGGKNKVNFTTSSHFLPLVKNFFTGPIITQKRENNIHSVPGSPDRMQLS